MNYLKSFFEILKKEHPFLLISLITSLFITVGAILLYMIIIENKNFMVLLFIVPTLIMLLLTFVAIYSYKYFPKLTNFIAFLGNLFIIIVIQIFIGLLTLVYMLMLDEEILFKNPEYYDRALASIHSQNRVEHFPKSIPNEAINVELNTSSNCWFGSEAIALKFNIDKKYIEKELNIHKFISIEHPNNYKHVFKDSMVNDNGRIDLDGFTFYVINDRLSESNSTNGFPYHYGIGVDDSKNTIIYYYTCPD